MWTLRAWGAPNDRPLVGSPVVVEQRVAGRRGLRSAGVTIGKLMMLSGRDATVSRDLPLTVFTRWFSGTAHPRYIDADGHSWIRCGA